MADEKATDAETGPGTGSESEAGTGPQGEHGSGAEGAGEDPGRRLSDALEQVERYKDQALRAQAEAENTRRRAARDVENAHKYALEKFAQELLPVLDSLEKAVELSAQTEGAQGIKEGVELCLKMFHGALEKAGISQIDPLGQPFDPQHHEAMAMVPSAEAEANSVIDVMQKGYTLNGRLVRAAKVVVSKSPE
jgi:molecular chaperone GrpE